MKNMIKRFTENFKKDEDGMTLVELLAVIVILAIVGVIAFVAIGNVIENSRKDAHIANATQIISAAELEVATGAEPITITEVSHLEETMSSEIASPWGENDTYAEEFTLSYDGATGEFSISSNGAYAIPTSTKVELASLDRDELTE